MVFGVPKHQEEALGGLRPFNYLVDIPAGVATIPGDGNTPVAFTSTKDVGRFVAASVDLDHWPKDTLGMVGDTLTYNEVTSIAEKVAGRTMERKYLSLDLLEKLGNTETDGRKKFFFQVRSFYFYEGSLIPFECTLKLIPNLYWHSDCTRLGQGICERGARLEQTFPTG